MAVGTGNGRDFIERQADQQRGGAAVEWTPADCCSLVAYRFRLGGGDFWRAWLGWLVRP